MPEGDTVIGAAVAAFATGIARAIGVAPPTNPHVTTATTINGTQVETRSREIAIIP